jgi:hypothetical protein
MYLLQKLHLYWHLISQLCHILGPQTTSMQHIERKKERTKDETHITSKSKNEKCWPVWSKFSHINFCSHEEVFVYFSELLGS